MKPTDIPTWIASYYPHESQNMNRLSQKLASVISDISPFIEDGFYTNHIKPTLNKDYDKSLWSGLWHLHVLWAMYAQGFELQKPDTNDDIIIIYDGLKIGVEVTFSGRGGPDSPLSRTYSGMTSEFKEVDHIDIDIINQAKLALGGKERKLAQRQPEIMRFVAMNEVMLTDGFRQWGVNTPERRSAITEDLRTRRPRGIDGLIYDFIPFGFFFTDSHLTLVGVDRDDSKHIEAIRRKLSA